MAATQGRSATVKDSAGQPPFRPGTIRKIKLQNFMCHDSFELDLGSRVNFIIGPNGSGKSALLTAVVVALGGRATVTSRAKKASDFVQYNKRFARVTLEIHNYDKIMEKDKAFKPDDYGKRIIIEKIIYKEDQGKLVIKNDQGKKVSDKKHELDEMLDHFSIFINNPICVLNQEVSKSFLHSKRPEDKFDLFMKATNLEQIENDYNEAKSVHGEWHDCNSRKAVAFKLLDNEKDKCKRKVKFLEERKKWQDRLFELNVEQAWAVRRDFEIKAEGLEQKLRSIEDQVEHGGSQIDSSNVKISSAEARIDLLKTKIDRVKKECDESKNKVKKLDGEVIACKREEITVTSTLEQDRRKLARLEKNKSDLIKSIEKFKEQQNNKDSAKENEKRKLEIEQIQRETSLLNAREKTLRERREQLIRSMGDIKQQIPHALGVVSNLKSDQSNAIASLRSLTVGKDELRKYSSEVQQICPAVEEAFRQGRFQKKPFGPLGMYIKVKTPAVASALESSLGKNAHSFTCDNYRDMLTLQNIFRTVRTRSGRSNFKEPAIIVRPYRTRHDVSQFKPVHATYKTLLDHIEISEDAVFNALVDRTGIENVMFIPDYNEARHIMVTPSLIPRGTTRAFTEDCHVMYPRTAHGGFRTIAQNTNLRYLFSSGNEELVMTQKRRIEHLQAELRVAEEKEASLRRSDGAQRIEYDSLVAEGTRIDERLRPLEVRLLELKTTLAEEQPQELTGYESELDDWISQINATKTRIAELEHQLATFTTDLNDKKEEKKSAEKVLQLREKELDDIKLAMAQEQDLINDLRDIIKEKEKDIENIHKARDELTRDLSAMRTQMEAHLREVREKNLSRPPEVRPIDEIQQEIKKITASLNVEVEEHQDPNELIDSLRKRVNEITQITSLRDHNQENYNTTTKSLKDREEGFMMLRKNICGSVSTQFASVMECMGMYGNLTIHLYDHYVQGNLVAKAKTLEMSIDTGKTGHQNSTQRPMIDANNSVEGDRRGARSQPNLSDGGPRSKRARMTLSPSEKENLRMTDTRSLSGGERSFSTVAFVLSLWHHCRSPFKLMDEIDVFMDMVTRRESYSSLIKFAKKPENEGQFIYFSPLELPEIDDPGNMVRVFEMPRIIRGNTQSPPTH